MGSGRRPLGCTASTSCGSGGSSMVVVSCPKLAVWRLHAASLMCGPRNPSEAPWWPLDQTDLISMCGVAPFCVSWLVMWIGDVAIAGAVG